MDEVTWQAIMAGLRQGIALNSVEMDRFIDEYKKENGK